MDKKEYVKTLSDIHSASTIENLYRKTNSFNSYNYENYINKYDSIKYSNNQNSNISNNPTNRIEPIKTVILQDHQTADTENQPNVPSAIAPTSAFTFGWSVYDASWEYFKAMQDGVLSKAQELGIDVLTHDQKSSSEEMIAGSINLINQNINALLISPFNPYQVPEIVAEANLKGIPVVVIDGGTGGADVLAFIVSDSFAGGILAGEYALTLIKKYSLKSKNVAIIKAEPTATYALRRGQGFKSVMIENGYQVVSEVYANGQDDLAYDEMNKIINSYGDNLAVVFCENGNMTLGAAQAISDAGKSGKIMLIGFDADPSVIDAIKQGFVQGTIAQQPYKMGEIGVETAYSGLLGIPISYDDWTTKEILMEVYLIDETGNPSLQLR